MSAQATDKFKKLSRRWVGQIGSGAVADGTTTTVPLASVTNLPTDTAVVAVIDRVDANGTATSGTEETIIGVVSGTNLTNCVRGAEGTAQAHNAGAVVEILVTAKGWNDLVDGLLVNHTQLGYHASLLDANGNNWIHQTATASAVNYLDVGNAVTGSDVTVTTTGSDSNISLNLVSRGTGVIKFNGVAAPTSSGSTDGWTTDSHTWTYASASTFTIAGVDLTTTFTKGTRLKFTNSTLKYAVVASSSFSTNTTVTIAVNTDYVLANATISSPFYSYQASPQGYPTVFNYTPTISAPTLTISSVVINKGVFSVVGSECKAVVAATFTTSGSNDADVTYTLPLTPTGTVSGQYPIGNGFIANTTNKASMSWWRSGSTAMSMRPYDNSNWGLAAGCTLQAVVIFPF